jgi:hypothetical protein
MDKSCRNVDRQCNGGDADLEEASMQGTQAGDGARRDSLACQLGASATQPCNAAATTEESAHHSCGAPVILEASKTTLVEQLRWEDALGERRMLFRGEELAGEVIGLGGGMNRARDDLLLSGRSRIRHSRRRLGAGQHNDLAQVQGSLRLTASALALPPAHPNRERRQRTAVGARPQCQAGETPRLGGDLVLVEQD